MNKIDFGPMTASCQAQIVAADKFTTDSEAAAKTAANAAKALDPAGRAKIYADHAKKLYETADAVQNNVLEISGDPANILAPLLALAGDYARHADNFLAEATAASTDTPAPPPLG